jgi:mono/diheme cytochrome c family protein
MPHHHELRHRKGLAPVSVVALLCMLCAGCIGAQRVGEPFDRVPELDTANLRVGHLVFYQHCHQCHPNGEGGLAPAINNKPLPQALMAFQVRRGMGAMPAFPKEAITDRELDALTDYLVALRRTARQ